MTRPVRWSVSRLKHGVFHGVAAVLEKEVTNGAAILKIAVSRIFSSLHPPSSPLSQTSPPQPPPHLRLEPPPYLFNLVQLPALGVRLETAFGTRGWSMLKTVRHLCQSRLRPEHQMPIVRSRLRPARRLVAHFLGHSPFYKVPWANHGGSQAVLPGTEQAFANFTCLRETRSCCTVCGN